MRHNYLCLLIFIILFSCNRTKQSDYNPPINFTRALNDSSITIDKLLTNQFTIIHYINIDCSVCISELQIIDSLMQYYYDIGCLGGIIVSGQRVELFEYYLKPMDVQTPIFWDPNYDHFNLNNLTYDKKKQTLLVDKNRHILLRGSIIPRKRTKSFYKKTQQIIKKNP